MKLEQAKALHAALAAAIATAEAAGSTEVALLTELRQEYDQARAELQQVIDAKLGE